MVQRNTLPEKVECFVLVEVWVLIFILVYFFSLSLSYEGVWREEGREGRSGVVGGWGRCQNCHILALYMAVVVL